ncbi:diacylglycerol kinase family protein [Mangrovibacillus cuniculi]|uniref:Diacylglycerol kinase family protein n=1 Tax=Mangrovibacillus cuniculi TaxID=2593652 RepID=A0A7S8CBH5_9BACI|nr:diacylglycerol kinase family protein [Mangrovibacillus cuniculi]QPC46921.1 diacylglycerol kinase family protein [Mangrovibacillus cuniculi]
MGYRERKYSFKRSFGYAITGVWYGLKKERHMQFHIAATISVTILGLLTRITLAEWRTIWLSIGLVISLELVNTAIEKCVDLVTQEYHPIAKIAKDVAAGAVLVAATVSVLVGGSIFLPYWF